MKPLRGLAVALAATAVLFAGQTLAYWVVDAPVIATIFRVGFVAADALLVYSLFRLRAATVVTWLALLLGVYELVFDVTRSSMLAASESVAAFLLAVMLVLVLRAAGKAPRGLFYASIGALVVALVFEVHRMIAPHRDPTIVWIAWAAQIARVGLLCATAWASEPKPIAEPAIFGGPYRAAAPRGAEGEEPALERAALVDALTSLRRGTVARFAVPLVTLVLVYGSMLTSYDGLPVAGVLFFFVARAATGAILAEHLGRVRRHAPKAARSFDVAASGFAIASLVDLGLALWFFIATSESVRHGDDWVLMGLPVALLAGLVAQGATGRGLEQVADVLGETGLATRASRLTALAIAIGVTLAVTFVLVLVQVGGGPGLALFLLFAAAVGWIVAFGILVKTLGDLRRVVLAKQS